MHIGTLRTHGPLHQAPLQTHMGEGSRTLQMMGELDEGWDQLVKLRQLHPSWMLGIVPTSPTAPGTGPRQNRRPEPTTKGKAKRALDDTAGWVIDKKPTDKKNSKTAKGKQTPDKAANPKQPGGKGKGAKPKKLPQGPVENQSFRVPRDHVGVDDRQLWPTPRMAAHGRRASRPHAAARRPSSSDGTNAG